MSAPGGPDPDLIVTLEDSMSEITSLFLDLVCLLATAKVVLLGKGAR